MSVDIEEVRRICTTALDATQTFGTRHECSGVCLRALPPLLDEIERLRAAIGTPEVYAGVVTETLERSRDALVVENKRLRAVVEQMKSSLLDVEWSGEGHLDEYGPSEVCPDCQEYKADGHASHCAVAAALAAAKGVTEEE